MSVDPLDDYSENQSEQNQPLRILDLHTELLEDSAKIRVYLTLTPFRVPPNLVAQLLSPADEVLRTTTIIGLHLSRFVFTIHLPAGVHPPLNLRVRVSQENEVRDETLVPVV